MVRLQRSSLRPGPWAALFALLWASGLAAQGRLLLPQGSVILVQTTTALQSTTAQPGQTFETMVVDTVRADNYTVIPAGSRIRGVVTFAQRANRQQSGVIQVNFDRLTLPDGSTYALSGKLTSTDPAERRQIETDPNARVVLVGGRSGVGPAIAGAGSESSPASSILAALGSLLSQGQDVQLPAGTRLAVQLEQGLALNARGRARTGPDAYTLYTAADQIRAAQQALAQQNYYRGAISGQLDGPTQRALFEFQVDHGITATGNLDGRTAQALGVSAYAGATGGGMYGATASSSVLSADQASAVRRGAQTLLASEVQSLGISTTGRLDPRRSYSEGDMRLWFALAAFSDNASMYEQLVRLSGNVDGAAQAGRALVDAAQRVDDALQQARPSYQVQNTWANIRSQLAGLDPSYR